jgi:two-component system CheB/CheR fusion protein
MRPANPDATRSALRMVGLGASAGGLKPLEQFLSQVPLGTGLAFLVVQHLDPTHETLLAELLQKASVLPVHAAVNGTPVAPDTVYVIPPDTELTVRAGLLQLEAPAEARGHRLPIDALFHSLAREQGSQAIGVLFSGMGADGTRGLSAIHAEGGLTLVQTPVSAQFTAMPQSAIDAGCVDVVAGPADMLPHLMRAVASPAPATPEGPAPAALADVLALVQAHTRHDLTAYKPSTLLRRIDRRMAVHGMASVVAYVAFLGRNPQEVDLLFREMLIGVTAFFRDPEAWQALQEDVLPALLARPAAHAGPLRAWVVACSTGEEAYSLAMCLLEAMDTWPVAERRELQIFATDLNADAIAAARSGHFAPSIAATLTPQRLARFFTTRPNGYQIQKQVRDCVLFAQHDVTVDPPFTRLDIVSCRNLFIYFNAALQQRLVPLFHYSLRTGGVLWLGSSETVGRTQVLFRPLHAKARLYARNEDTGAGSAAIFPTHRRTSLPSAQQELTLAPPDPTPPQLQSLADQVLLQQHTPAAVLVNEGGDIVYVSGRTGRYLEAAAGKANWNIHVMARPPIRAQLAVALRTALQDRRTVELRALRLEDDGEAAVDITVQAVLQPQALAGMAMVVFRPATPAAAPGGAQPPRADGNSPELAEALLHYREEMVALRQAMRASQEELQATNEALQAANEELQSANEELTTSKEEAQSMNEELQTINGELQAKLDDLALAQSDMQNLLNSTDIATLFLDEQLNVRRYTDKMARVIPLREGDIGRPLSELASTLLYPTLNADVQETLRTLVFSEKQIATNNGLWFTVRVMPYRTLANVIQGVVITFVDITAAKELESRLREA